MGSFPRPNEMLQRLRELLLPGKNLAQKETRHPKVRFQVERALQSSGRFLEMIRLVKNGAVNESGSSSHARSPCAIASSCRPRSESKCA